MGSTQSNDCDFTATATDLTDVAGRMRLNGTGIYMCKPEVSMIWNSDEEMAIRVAVIVSSILSFLGAGFIIITYILHPNLRKPAYRLILTLSIADFGSSLAYLLGTGPQADPETYCPLPICYIQAGLSQFFEVSAFFWTGCIAFNIWAILVIQWSPEVIMKLEKFYHMAAWGLPFIFVIIAAAGNLLGDGGVWCWIIEESPAARVLLYYLWLILIIIFVTYAYIHVMIVIRGTEVDRIIARLRWYIVVFVATHLMSIINRFQNFAFPCEPIFALYMLQAITEPTQGFFNAIVYGMNPKILGAYKNMAANCQKGSVENDNKNVDIIQQDSLAEMAGEEDDPEQNKSSVTEEEL